MKLNYDFESYQPPRMTEKSLMETLHNRQLIRRTVLLIMASLLINICMALMAFVIAPYSMEAGIACLVLLGLSLAGSGIIAVIFAREWSTHYRSKPGSIIALGL